MERQGKGILGDREATAEEIRTAMGFAIRYALGEHKDAGVPVAIWDWEQNRAVLVPAGEIVLSGDDGEQDQVGQEEDCTSPNATRAR